MKLRYAGQAAALALVAALALTGCGSDSENDGASPSPTPTSTAATSPSPSAQDVAALAGVKVEGDAGAEPKLTFDTPFSVSAPTTRVVDKGDGDPLKEGQMVSIHYVVFGADGKRVGSTWKESNNTPEQFTFGDPSVPLLNTAFKGLNVGGRVLLANVQAGADGTSSTSVMLLEAASAKTIPSRAEGEAVTPAAGLPVVTLADNGEPSIDFDKLPAEFKNVTTLTAQTLIKGDGPAVTADQTVTAHYTGWTTDGKVFDSSWSRNAPASFPLANVIQGWQQGLAGQTVGSQVLLIIPPDLGYGDQGTGNGSIPGGATLIFVVDILAAS